MTDERKVDVSAEVIAHIVKHLRECGVMSATRAVELFEALASARDEAERERDRLRAGALIIAELERLARAAAMPTEGSA